MPVGIYDVMVKVFHAEITREFHRKTINQTLSLNFPMFLWHLQKSFACFL